MKSKTEQTIRDEIASAKAVGSQMYAPTEFGDAPVPSDVYFGQDRFQREMERVFRRSWIPVARQSELQGETFITRSVLGSGVLLTRDADGMIRGFHNTCRHRGSVVASGSGCAQRLTCSYHGWTYELDGRLTGVPDPGACAPAFDRSQNGLQPVAVESCWGWLWVNLASDPPSLQEFLGAEILDELENWQFDAVDCKGSREIIADFNWKVGVEGTLESIHFPLVHRRSVHPIASYKFGVMAWWANHSRVVMPLRDPRLYEPEGVLGNVAYGAGVEIFPGLNALQRSTYSIYYIWPWTFLNLLPNHFSVVTLEPVDVARTRCRIDVFGQPGASDAQLAFWETIIDGYQQAALQEDASALCGVQRGLSGAFRPAVNLSHFECRIRHFRRVLENWAG